MFVSGGGASILKWWGRTPRDGHSTDQNETQKSGFMTEKVDPKVKKFKL